LFTPFSFSYFFCLACPGLSTEQARDTKEVTSKNQVPSPPAGGQAEHASPSPTQSVGSLAITSSFLLHIRGRHPGSPFIEYSRPLIPTQKNRICTFQCAAPERGGCVILSDSEGSVPGEGLYLVKFIDSSCLRCLPCLTAGRRQAGGRQAPSTSGRGSE